MMKYQKYAEYKDSGEWLGEIPSHWDIQPTKRFFRLITEPAPDNNNHELLSVYTEIGVKPRKELEQKGNKATTTDGYWLVKKGDIVINKLLAWMGAVGYSEYDGVTSPAYDILRPTKKLNPKFYHYLFRTKIANMEFKRWSRGIMEMRLRLYFDELGRISMPFPTFEEQNKIVDFLDHEITQIDSLIEKQQQLIQLLKEKRQAVIGHAVTKGLNSDVPMKDSSVEWLRQVPEHWEVGRLKNVLSIKNGRDYKTVEVEDGGYPVYGSGGVFKRSSAFLYDGISLLFGRKGTIDKPLLVQGKFWTVDTMFYSEIDPKFIPEYIYYQSLGFPFDKLSTNTALPSMTQEDLLNLGFVIPSKDEQQRIVEYLKNYIAKNSALMIRANKAIQLMQERRTALISAAVTGKIDVRNWQNPTEAKMEFSA
ncbi:restriction endonuclease subunit S [Acinetobacter sp.]|uniref:restriction endonuclease subunit S n=1 Tax=Acinetobacter sp. TaxID=472 RepID=UPI0035B237AE